MSATKLLVLRQCQIIIKRNISTLNKFTAFYQSLWRKKIPKPPYDHLTQIGDPILRRKADEVPLDMISSPEIQEIIAKMKKIMNQYEAIGISAPQIGCPLQIIAVEFNKKSMEALSKEVARARECQIFPLKIFINPRLHIKNFDKVVFPEACFSVMGYSASVSRYYEVIVSGFNEFGKEESWEVKGWPARIIQHELDHLKGKLFVDIMDSKTFQYDFWSQVNSGKLGISRRKLFRI